MLRSGLKSVSGLVEKAIAHVNGRIPVVVGTGNNSTAESIGLFKAGRISRCGRRC